MMKSFISDVTSGQKNTDTAVLFGYFWRHLIKQSLGHQVENLWGNYHNQVFLTVKQKYDTFSKRNC